MKRIFIERKKEFNVGAIELISKINDWLKINIQNIRIFDIYDIDNIDEDTFKKSLYSVFSEKNIDNIFSSLDLKNKKYFAIKPLAAQFDIKSSSAEECIKLLNSNSKARVWTSKLYIFDDDLSFDNLNRIKNIMINKIESEEKNLKVYGDKIITKNFKIKILDSFINFNKNELLKLKNNTSFSIEDLFMIQEYFKIQEKRNPTEAEFKLLETYWSDHCRHTTFNTQLDNIKIENQPLRNQIIKSLNFYLKLKNKYSHYKSITLMDIGTIMFKHLRNMNIYNDVEISNEINACSIFINAKIDNKTERWLIQFKNETHNHPTEIEPYGGASTCLGGAIRDPLSGRSYVYQGMRISGSANPNEEMQNTLKNKLPQRIISKLSAKGFSSYGNQIGIPTSFVKEISHPDFKAKHMEVGVVVGASPADNIKREDPELDDLIILIGAKTGKDGIGGASGSSKKHDDKSLSSSSSEVQKGNPIEQRKLQRLFRNPKFSRLIKKSNDFGAGGVSVAVGELADSIDIYLDLIPLKYEGLNPTEILISESQERMAVVINPKNWRKIKNYCDNENTQATIIGKITDTNRLIAKYKDNIIVNISRDFLNTNGAKRNIDVKIGKQKKYIIHTRGENINDQFIDKVSNLNVASQKGLQQQFDFTIGNSTVLSPYGGLYQLSPSQVSVQKIPIKNKYTNTSTMLSYGYDPYIFSESPYLGAIYAIIESIAKIVAAGGNVNSIKLSFQEYFENMGNDSLKWGKPLSALLGTFEVMKVFNIAAIGGKDSMSGTYNELNVPPTLISFALSIVDAENVISTDFKDKDNYIYLFNYKKNENGMPNILEIQKNMQVIEKYISLKTIISAFAIEKGGIAAALAKMSFGNDLGFNITTEIDLYKEDYGSILVESKIKLQKGLFLGMTSVDWYINNVKLNKKKIKKEWCKTFEKIYPTNHITKPIDNLIKKVNKEIKDNNIQKEIIKIPKVLIPIFPGTNCEYDVAERFVQAGAKCEGLIFCNSNEKSINKSIDKFSKSLENINILALVGGFSASDEPNGSGKFIVNVLKNPKIKEGILKFRERGGMILGICNGFQALIKSGLLPYGKINDLKINDPTLFKNDINNHVSKYVNTKVCSINSPWLKGFKLNQVHSIPISHGEGKFVINEKEYIKLLNNDQIAFEYTYDVNKKKINNPNGSNYLIEGIISRDGRILGKMGHSERYGKNICKNIYGNKDQDIFKNIINYLKGV